MTTEALPGGAATSRYVPLAWRNLTSNKQRLVRSSAGIGFAVLLMLVQLGFERGFFDASLGMVRQLDGDLFIMSASKYRFGTEDPFKRDVLTTARGVAGVASIAPLYATWTHFFWKNPTGDQSYMVQAFAFEPETQVFLIPQLNDERARLKEANSVIVDRRSRSFLGMSGDAKETEINGKTVQIVGSYVLGPDFMSDGTVMMSDRTFAAILTGNAAAATSLPVEVGVIKTTPGSDVAAVEKALQTALPKEIRVFDKGQIVDFEQTFQADLSSAGPIFWMGTVVGFVVGMLISYQIIYTDLSDQLPQYATLKGMGYSNLYLTKIVYEQAILSALAAFVPAWLFCLVVYRVIGELALMPLHMSLRNTLLSLGLSIGMCLVSATFSIRRVVTVDPAEVF